MRQRVTIGLIGVTGFFAGMAVTRHFSVEGTREEAAVRVEETRRAERGSGRPPASAPSRNAERGLSRLFRVIRHYQVSGDPEIIRELERMSTPELRRMIEDLVTSTPSYWSEETEAAGRLVDAAIKEWYRREGEDALRQAEEMGDEKARRSVLFRLINAAVYETPELGKKWADRFRDENGKDWYRYLVSAASQGALGRSAEDFLKVRELFKDEEIGVSLHGAFAEDFDFGKVIAAMPVGHGGSAISRWAAREPEGAWEMVREMIGEHGESAGRHVGDVFEGIARVKGDAGAAEWLAGSIGEVPEELQRGAFQSLHGLTPERSGAVMAALSDRDDRMLFASVLLNPHNDRGNGLAGLRALDSDAIRAEALMAAARRYAPGMGNGGQAHFETVHGYFDRTMEDLALPAETREQVKAALTPE